MNDNETTWGRIQVLFHSNISVSSGQGKSGASFDLKLENLHWL
jgi:hypothetical protein